MPFDPITWALGFTLNKAGTWAVDQRKELRSQLKKAVQDWADELPEHVCVVPDAIFQDPKAKDDDTSNSPALSELRKTIAADQIATSEQWRDAIYERRRFVVSSFPQDQLQSFFRATDEEVRHHVDELSENLHRICQQNEKLFRTSVASRVDQIAKLIAEQNEQHTNIAALESHVSETLGVGRMVSMTDLGKAKTRRLDAFVDSLVETLGGHDPVTNIVIEFGRAIGLNPEDAVRSWISRLLGVDRIAESHARKVAIIGGSFHSEDQSIEFVGQHAADESDVGEYTQTVVNAVRVVSPYSQFVIFSPQLEDGVTNDVWIAKCGAAALSRKDVGVVVLPWKGLGEGHMMRTIIRELAAFRIIPILPSWEEEPDFTDPELKTDALRESGVIFVGLMRAISSKLPERVLAFPDVLPIRKDLKTIEMRTGCSLGVAAGFVIEALHGRPEGEMQKIVGDIYHVAKIRPGMWRTPDLRLVRARG
jgi:hypothetical protein